LNDLRTGDRIRVTTGPNNFAAKIEAVRQGEQAFANPQEETRRRPNFEEFPREGVQSERRDDDAAWLGVVLKQKQSGEGRDGVELTQVYPSGPAARSGLYSGDVLVQIAGEKIASPEQAAKLIEESKPNEAIELVVVRDGQERTVQANLGARRDFLFEERFQGQNGENSSESDGNQYPDHAMMLDTICTLLTFQFTRHINGREPQWQRVFNGMGRVVLTITFAALFTAALNTSLLLLADRLNFLLRDIPTQLTGLFP
jgi:hypothetical protein